MKPQRRTDPQSELGRRCRSLRGGLDPGERARGHRGLLEQAHVSAWCSALS